MEEKPIKLVTLGGECLALLFQRESIAADRDGVFYLFKLTDLAKNRGERLASVYRPGSEFRGADYDMRISTVLLNVLRHAFDSGLLSFDLPCEIHKCQELVLDATDFLSRPAVSDQELRQFIIHKAYWQGFRHAPVGASFVINFAWEPDLDYLGVKAEDIKRNVWLLREQGLLVKAPFPAVGRPTARLIELYEAKQGTTLPSEALFPRGTKPAAISVQDGQWQHENRHEWDVFISHASEDKDAIARPLAQRLQARGLRVWYDELSLTVGDSLRESIDHGLAHSEFGVIILSKHFFEKHWPTQELNGLATREVNGKKVILPVWHEVSFEEVRQYSPMLADRVAVTTEKGVGYVVEQLLAAMK